MNGDSGSTLHLKMISLVLALTVFSLVRADSQSTHNYRFDVRLSNPPEGYQLMNELETVEATVQGPSRAFQRLDPDRLQAIRLEDVSPDQSVYRLRASNFNLPPELKVTNFIPETITLDFAKLQPIEVRVRPVTRGQPSPGYVVEKVTVEPKSITVRAPNGTWEEEYVPTYPVNIQGATQSIERNVQPRIHDYKVEFDETKTVKVNVTIKEHREIAELTNQPVQVIGPDRAKTTLSHDSVNIEIKGPTAGVEQVRNNGLLVTLDISNVLQQGSGRYRLHPNVENLPENVHLLSVQPQTIVVDLRLPQKQGPPTSDVNK